MKLINKAPLSLIEVKELIEKLDKKEGEISKGEEVQAYLKKFIKIKMNDAKKLKEDLQKLDLIKIKPDHIVKIIDILPEDASDLNKIFVDASLDEDETKKILEVVKKYK